MHPQDDSVNGTESKADCYSDGERAWMEYGQNLRAIALQPALRLASRWGVTADAITLASGICGALFFPLWLCNQPLAALVTLLLHVLLDGLDGPLARFQQVASPRGSFVDTFTDQIVVTLVMIAYLVHNPSSLSIALGSIYIFLYAIVVSMAMVRNALAVPYSWLVRPRFFVFAAIFLEWLSRWPVVLVVLTSATSCLLSSVAAAF